MDAYLQRIGASRDSSLAQLQESHLRSVPFENLYTHMDIRIVLEIPWLYDKVVVQRRGGFCYELNGLFAELLRHLGHHVDLLAVRVFGGEELGPPFGHLTLLVDHEWLCDVGFGAFTLHPLRWDSREEQQDPHGLYRLVDHGDDVDVYEEDRLRYRVERRPRELAEFVPACWWQQTAPESHFRVAPRATVLTPHGRKTQTDQKLVVTTRGCRVDSPVDDPAAAFLENFGLHFRQSSASGVLRQS
ncbi:arylamine N-acetyltransferase family protein [Lentzea chajnantorensis]